MEPTKFDMKYAAVRRAIIEQRFSKLNDKQREAVYQTEGPLLILAGAGSGKTTVLINRIINILKFGDGLDNPYAPDWATECSFKTKHLKLKVVIMIHFAPFIVVIFLQYRIALIPRATSIFFSFHIYYYMSSLIICYYSYYETATIQTLIKAST